MFTRSLAKLVMCLLAVSSTAQADDTPGRSYGSAISNPDAAWQLGATLNHPDGIYQVGNQLEVTVTAPRRCYMHIININPEGRVAVLWPVKDGDTSLMEPGQTVRFPDPASNPRAIFEAQAPVGKELIICFATLKPLNLRETESAKTFLEFLEQSKQDVPSTVAQIRSFVTKIEPTPAGWNALSLEVVTKEKETGTRGLPSFEFLSITSPIRITGPAGNTTPIRDFPSTYRDGRVPPHIIPRYLMNPRR